MSDKRCKAENIKTYCIDGYEANVTDYDTVQVIDYLLKRVEFWSSLAHTHKKTIDIIHKLGEANNGR